MKRELLIIQAMQNILQEVEEGIHIVDKNGTTLVYNKAMERIEGLESEQVIGKYLLDVFPTWQIENSTLLSAINQQKSVHKEMQSYLNLKGKKITTMNTTFPIFHEGIVIGAVEIAKNLTNVNNMSEQILELQERLMKPEKPKKRSTIYYDFDSILGNNKKLLEAIKMAKRAAMSNSSVLIEGETGTGKELFAQSVHSGSDRCEKPFIAQNCAAFPESLLESILFGTVKGSFTGALDKPGLFEQANGGTLLLDEINSMSITLQAKLLRVLQEGYIRRIGGSKDVIVDVRIIATTNENILELVERGKFRKDLFYRLNVVNIKIPSLRDRLDDVKMLSEHFIRLYNEKLGKDVWMIGKDIEALFQEYTWPGNIRELQNMIETAMNMVMDEHVITKEHLAHKMDELAHRKNQDMTQQTRIDLSNGINDYLESLEKQVIQDLLLKYNSNISKTSKVLKISRQNLQYKMKKYELE
ncbi:MAG: sigma 54-interacting transcriptional regulator [Clostridia bacterium]|nr:sigma 54-interacting transcriptional regulator [Clostridia bacterium]